MISAQLYTQLLTGWILLGLVTFVVLFFVTAPYGRHARRGWGPSMPASLAWVTMETPAALLMVLYYLHYAPDSWLMLVLLGLWEWHYLYRAYLYPFTLQHARPVPVLIVLFGMVFNAGNTFFNGLGVFHFSPHPQNWMQDPRFVLGVVLFVIGTLVNRHADTVLNKLHNVEGYHIPFGGLYRWISCPNYLGEILIWCGWALAVWNPAGVAFAMWTIANLAPRAAAHHRWYHKTFADYPAERKRLIPKIW